MSKNSHRQKYNGFSFAFRLTRRTSDHRKETEKDGFSSEKRTLMQEMKRILRFERHSRHFARMKKLSSFGDIVKWRKKNRNLETNLDFVILQGRRNFAHFPTNFHKEWKNMETNRDFRNQLWRHQASNTMLVIFFLMPSSFGFQRSSYKQLFFIDIKCFFSPPLGLQQHWQLRWMQFSTPTDKIISTSTRSPNR